MNCDTRVPRGRREDGHTVRPWLEGPGKLTWGSYRKIMYRKYSRGGRERLPTVAQPIGPRGKLTVCRPSVTVSKYSLSSLQLKGAYQDCLTGFVTGCDMYCCAFAPGTLLR